MQAARRVWCVCFTLSSLHTPPLSLLPRRRIKSSSVRIIQPFRLGHNPLRLPGTDLSPRVVSGARRSGISPAASGSLPTPSAGSIVAGGGGGGGGGGQGQGQGLPVSSNSSVAVAMEGEDLSVAARLATVREARRVGYGLLGLRWVVSTTRPTPEAQECSLLPLFGEPLCTAYINTHLSDLSALSLATWLF